MKNGIKLSCMLLVVIFMLSTALAGCGGSESTNEPQTTAATEEPGTEEASTEKAPEDYKGTVTIWGYEDEAIKQAAALFNEKYPNIKLEYIPVGSAEYVQKLQTTLATGSDMPDIAFQEIDSRGKIFSLDCWDNLENAPYNLDRSRIVDFVLPAMTNEKGEIVGVDWQLCPSGLAYKRDMAKQWLGTDDPAEVEAMFPDWDAFIKKGQEIKQASGNKVFMFAGLGDVNRIAFNQVITEIVEGNKLHVDSTLGEVFKLQAKMRDAGVADKVEIWSPAWNTAYSDDTHMFFPCTTWTSFACIKPNNREDRTWGLIKAPGGSYSWGGTSLGIYKESKVKEEAWQFINWLLLTKEGADFNKEVTGYPIPLKEIYEDSGYSFYSTNDPLFGGQDINTTFFEEIMPNVKMRQITEYDAAMWDVISLITNALQSDANLDADTALSKAKEELSNKLPELEIVP